jgi:predicted GH43/DUF377 family glycosyl hydrolase
MTNAWTKHPASPVLGPGYCLQALFDCCILAEDDRLRMWLSWRDLRSIAVSESENGVDWTGPRIALEVAPSIEWEKTDVNRPSVLRVGDQGYMWYTGQDQERGTGAIGLATSRDGITWERVGDEPVLAPAGGWERQSLMCPHVLHEGGRFRMWYSGGDIHEPDAIGYAESDDGVHWQRPMSDPVLSPAGGWERDRVTAACIVPRADDYLAFYVGFADGFEQARLGMARSRDGLHDWERYPGNPILSPGEPGAWDDCNVYKPSVVLWRGLWHLYYNASRNSDRREQIGLATVTEIGF